MALKRMDNVGIVVDDLGGTIDSRVSAERSDFYLAHSLFGGKVDSAFPSAHHDIGEAGTCYATDRNTACVMHLMRVLELGLSAFASPPDRSSMLRLEAR